MIDKLEFLLALASEEHFGRAAELCRVTQSTFSSGIKQLEATLGVMLVQRGSRYVGLTPEGERALNWARRIVGASRSLRQEINTMRKSVSGQIRLAAIPMALPTISSITTPFRDKYPDVHFTVYSRTSNEIAKMIENLEVDAGVTYIDDPAFSKLLALPLYHDEYCFIAEADSPLGNRDKVTWSEVAQMPLCLLTPDTQTRQIIDGMLRKAGGELPATLESDAVMILFDHVRTGKWASVLSAKFAQTLGLTETLRAIPIVEPEVTHTIGVVIPQREPMTPLNNALVAEIRRLSKTLN